MGNNKKTELLNCPSCGDRILKVGYCYNPCCSEHRFKTYLQKTGKPKSKPKTPKPRIQTNTKNL